MAYVTLVNLFQELDGKSFDTRRKLELAVLEVFNRHLAELPVGYSYEDAIEGARAAGWLIVNGPDHGVRVRVSEPGEPGSTPETVAA